MGHFHGSRLGSSLYISDTDRLLMFYLVLILYYIIMHDLGITVNIYFLFKNLIPKLLT